MPRPSPGPWLIEPIHRYQKADGLVGAAIVNSGLMIAEVRGAILIDGAPHAEHLLNACLIASAPDLNRALRSARATLTTVRQEIAGERRFQGYLASLVAAELHVANRILAKASGGLGR